MAPSKYYCGLYASALGKLNCPYCCKECYKFETCADKEKCICSKGCHEASEEPV